VSPAPAARPIISGLGISQVGRRLGIPPLALTAAAARQAVADAGLTAADIDGIATMGDTPPDYARSELGIEAVDCTGGFDTGGLLSPLMSAVQAVAEGRSRHVLVYRTVQMMGGTVESGPKQSARPPTDKPAKGPGPFDHLLAAHAYSAANWLAMH
jgi:hypothetical protein